MDVAATLARMGGCATWAELRGSHSARAIRSAVGRGRIDRTGHGRYALPSVEAHRREAHRRTAARSHLSAAAAHGWKVKTSPEQPWLTVPRNRKVSAAGQATANVCWADLTADEVAEGVTTPLRTVLDCARALPFDEALAVADSALRAGVVARADLVDEAARVRGPGAGRARRVAAAADGRAANPFESCLRAITLQVPGLTFVPQVRLVDVGMYAVVDLADVDARLVLEAEGFEFHGTREGLYRDCRRYTELTVFGYEVLRFTWEDVMFHPDWVLWAIRAALARRLGESIPTPPVRLARRAVAS